MYVCIRHVGDQAAAFHDPVDDSQVGWRLRLRQHGHGRVEVPHTYTAERLDYHHHRCWPGTVMYVCMTINVCMAGKLNCANLTLTT